MATLPGQCDSKVKHPEHEWYKNNTLRRWCKGRKSDYKRRAPHPGRHYTGEGK